ncbi:phage tail tape measure protein [Ruminococcaceae bacterium OttesenSCG-928-I18]|nr:phage tail tape measure protein [Ruminococcaceae bacterium OttesenSCG-928-I18]
MARGAIKGIVVEIGGKADKLIRVLSDVEKKSKGLQSELKNVDRLLKFDPKNTELLSQKQKILANAIKETKNKLDTLKEAEKQVQAQFERGEVSEEAYRGLQQEIIETEQKLKSLTKQQQDFGSVAAQQVAVAGESVRAFGDGMQTVGRAMMPVTGAVVGLGTAAAGTAIGFESAFAGVQKTVDATDQEFAVLREDIRGMALEMPQSAEAIAGVAEAAGQLGVGVEDIEEFTRTMVMLGDTTNLSSEEAATAIARFTNITGTSHTEVDNFGSSLVALGNSSAATESDILSMATNLAAAGSQVGMTDAEILAMSATLSSLGLEAQAGGSAFSRVMKQMATDVELGGGNIENFAEVAGMSVQEFSDLFNNDAMGALNAFLLGLGDTESMGMSTIAMLDEMGITELRMSDALMRTSGSNDLLTRSLETSRTAWDENNALATEAETRYQTTESQLLMLKNQLVDVAISFGDVMLPVIRDVVNWLKNLVAQLGTLSPETKKTIVIVAAVVAAIGPLLLILGKVISTIGTIMTMAPKIVSTIKLVGTAFKGLGAAMAANPVGLIIAAIVALIAILVLAYNKCEWFREMVNDAFAQIKVAIQNAIQAAKPVIDQLIQSFQNLMEALRPVIEFIASYVISIFRGLAAAITPVIAAIKNVIDFVTNIINAFKALLQGDLDGFVQYIQAALQNVWQFIQNIVDAIVTYVVTFLESMGIDVKTIFQNIWQAIVGFFSGIGQWFADRFTEARDGIALVFSTIGTWFAARWEDIKAAFAAVGTWFQTVFQTAFDNIVFVFQAIGEWFAARWTDITTALALVGSWFLNMFQTAYNNVLSVFQAIGAWFAARWADIRAALATVASWFLNMFQNAYNNVVRVFQAIGAWFAARWADIKAALANVASWFLTTFTNAYNNVKAAFQAIGSWFSARYNDITNAMSGIASFFGNVFNQAWENVKSAFSGVTAFFQGIYDTITGIFSNIANSVKNAISGAVDSANSVQAGSASVRAMATGGVLRNGMAVVAEAGAPELIEMVNGEAIVTPLTNRGPVPVSASAGATASGVVLHQSNAFFSPKALDPAETARLNRRATQRTVLQLRKG